MKTVFSTLLPVAAVLGIGIGFSEAIRHFENILKYDGEMLKEEL